MPEITIRDCRYADLPEVAEVMARAFWEDNLFGDLIHPYRDEYPKDMCLYWLRRLRVSYWDYRYKNLVAVSRSEDGKEVIAGAAQWCRLGDGGKELECWRLDPRNMMMPLSSAAMKVHAWVWPNRASDPAQEDVIERAYPCFLDVWSGDRAESWYLEGLAVHPDFQGNSIGRMLVQWGLRQAQEERIVASVISTWRKEEFYVKCGFDEQYGRGGMGEGNPLADIQGSDMFWRWPRVKA